MTDATKEAGTRDWSYYSSLEVPIREVTFMAGIARDLAYELLDLECVRRSRKEDGEEVVIRMSTREYEQLYFAIENAHGRAEALERLYCEFRRNPARDSDLMSATVPI